MWRKKERTRGKRGGRGSRGMAWSTSGAETERGTGAASWKTRPQTWLPAAAQTYSGGSLVSAASLCEASAPRSGSFSVPLWFCSCSCSAGTCTAGNLQSGCWRVEEHWSPSDEGSTQEHESSSDHEENLQQVTRHEDERENRGVRLQRWFTFQVHFMGLMNHYIWLTIAPFLSICPLLKIFHSQVQNLCFLYFRILQSLWVITHKHGEKISFHHCN